MHAQSFARIRVHGDFQKMAAHKFYSYLNDKDEIYWHLVREKRAIEQELWNFSKSETDPRQIPW